MGIVDDINKKDNICTGMPVHNPLYSIGSVSFRGNFAKAELPVDNPGAIAKIVPEPLIYNDNKIYIVFIEVKELKEGFSKEDVLWNEIAVQVPVIHKGEPGLYVCDNYSDNIHGIISSREIYGYPKRPGNLAVSKRGNKVVVKLTNFKSKREILELTYTLFEKDQIPAHPGHSGSEKKMPKIILFKYIPSAIQGNRPDVKQLTTTKYGKPVIHEIRIGSGKIKIEKDAPEYLQAANIHSIGHLTFLDMETKLIGGEILHNYI
jgi:acetoacetate decarboxylase